MKNEDLFGSNIVLAGAGAPLAVLHADGSVKDADGVLLMPADEARAGIYAYRVANVGSGLTETQTAYIEYIPTMSQTLETLTNSIITILIAASAPELDGYNEDDMYFNSTDHKVYAATMVESALAWVDASSNWLDAGYLYINTDDSFLYKYNATTLVKVGAA